MPPGAHQYRVLFFLADQRKRERRSAVTPSRNWRAIVFSDSGIPILLALLKFVPLFLTNGQSGWHRDELDTLENARYLDWGYVSYPPVAPFIARAALVLFGPSMLGVHFFSTLAQALAMVLAGLMARESPI